MTIYTLEMSCNQNDSSLQYQQIYQHTPSKAILEKNVDFSLISGRWISPTDDTRYICVLMLEYCIRRWSCGISTLQLSLPNYLQGLRYTQFGLINTVKINSQLRRVGCMIVRDIKLQSIIMLHVPGLALSDIPMLLFVQIRIPGLSH